MIIFPGFIPFCIQMLCIHSCYTNCFFLMTLLLENSQWLPWPIGYLLRLTSNTLPPIYNPTHCSACPYLAQWQGQKASLLHAHRHISKLMRDRPVSMDLPFHQWAQSGFISIWVPHATLVPFNPSPNPNPAFLTSLSPNSRGFAKTRIWGDYKHFLLTECLAQHLLLILWEMLECNI